jgi:hypothetical protein
MPQPGKAMNGQQLVSDTDHVELSRLVTEHTWRADNGRADTIHELYVDHANSSCRRRQALEWGRRLVEAPAWRSILVIDPYNDFISRVARYGL